MDRQLGMFVKDWRTGAVKTRLGRELGGDWSRRLYQQFVETLLERFADQGDRRVLAYWPRESGEWFSRLAATWIPQPQQGADLGERMAHYFRAAAESGAQRIVLIGSDSPTLPGEFVERAFELLRETDVVLGPSRDGGYYLVGLRANSTLGLDGLLALLFNDLPWSTPAVWRLTTGRLETAAAGYAALPSWYDVDVREDLQTLAGELQTACSPDPPEAGSAAMRAVSTDRSQAAWRKLLAAAQAALASRPEQDQPPPRAPGGPNGAGGPNNAGPGNDGSEAGGGER